MLADDLLKDMIQEEKYIKLEQTLHQKQSQQPNLSTNDLAISEQEQFLQVFLNSIDLSFLDQQSLDLQQLVQLLAPTNQHLFNLYKFYGYMYPQPFTKDENILISPDLFIQLMCDLGIFTDEIDVPRYIDKNNKLEAYDENL